MYTCFTEYTKYTIHTRFIIDTRNIHEKPFDTGTLPARGPPPPPVKSPPPPSKMWLFIVIARRKCEKRILSLAQYYKISTIILQKLI